MERVCFIRPADAPGPIKVLVSEDPPAAVREMEEASPTPLHLIGSVPASDWPLEWWAQELAPWHLRASWYDARAQTLCLIEDALTGVLTPPGPHGHVPDRVPASCRPPDPEEERRKRWAFPEPDPYPEPPQAPELPRPRLKALVLQVLQAAEAA